MTESLSESRTIRRYIEQVAKDVVKKETQDCFRLRKAVVVFPPDGSTCTVQFVGETQELTFPYSSKVANVNAGETVWVAIIFGSLRNAIVWETGNFQ